MFKRKLQRKAPDPERDELKRLIHAADITPPIKALAIIGVGRMSPAQVTQALNVVPTIMEAAKNGDRDAVAQVLRDQGLDELTIADSMSYYDKIVSTAPERAEG